MEKKEINIIGKIQSGRIYPEFFPIAKDETVLNVGCGNGVQAAIYKNSYKKMIGVDINPARLVMAEKVIAAYNVQNFSAINANVEKIPLHEEFDKAIAIDIIEHVVRPEAVIGEIYRLLKKEGRLLITFPAMHDKWENFFRFVGRKIIRRKGKTIRKEGWDPDAHQYDYSLKEWLKLMDQGNFRLVASRASTMFPPLHYLGIPKFWFSNKFIHKIDSFFCRQPGFKNYGQALVCIFEKRV